MQTQMYKSLLSFKKECIFENIFLIVVNMNNDTKKMVNMKILHFFQYAMSHLFSKSDCRENMCQNPFTNDVQGITKSKTKDDIISGFKMMI